MKNTPEIREFLLTAIKGALEEIVDEFEKKTDGDQFVEGVLFISRKLLLIFETVDGKVH